MNLKWKKLLSFRLIAQGDKVSSYVCEFQIEIRKQLKNFIETNRPSDDVIDDECADMRGFNGNEEFEDNLEFETN